MANVNTNTNIETSDDSEITFGSLPAAKQVGTTELDTTQVESSDAFDPPTSSTPATTSSCLKEIAASMASIQAMCEEQAERFDERLEEARKSQQEDMAQVAAQFRMALEQQSLQHAEETRELRAEISHLKSLEQSQVLPRLPPPTQSLSTQSPPACVDFQDELADRLDQIHTMAEAVRKPPTPPQPSKFTERRKLGKSLKPNTFDGVSPWEDYKAQFDLIAELNSWEDETKAVYLAASLKGHAQAVLGDLDERRRRDFTSLVAALSSRFGAEHQTELYRTQLKTLLRKKEQTLPELAQTTRRLTRQAYPEATEGIRETLARDHFIDALPDADVRWRIQ